MPSFKDITVVAIHGNGGIEREIPSLMHNLKCLPGSQGLIVTDKLVDTNIRQVELAQGFDYYGFQDFLVYCLFQHIETDYALIVQSDGWCLNPNNWRDEWFDYDFIGGYTHAAWDPSNNNYRMYYSWVGLENQYVVQNGGFSLRSKRFLEAPTKYGIVKHIKENAMLNNEDVQLCCWMRPAFEKVGMKYAPKEESMLFSFEHLSPILHKDVDLTKVFGQHSRFRRLTGEYKMNWELPDDVMQQIPWEDRIYKLFQNYGYEICHTQPNKTT